MLQLQENKRRMGAIRRWQRESRLTDANALNVALMERPLRMPEWENEQMSEVEVKMAFLTEEGMICILLSMTIGEFILPHRWMPSHEELSELFSRLSLSLRSSL